MIPILADKLPALTELCRRYNVERLELFGSAATGKFDPARSDIDFLVNFGPAVEQDEFHQYIDFLLDCEDLFGRKVDLVEEEAIRNPYFREAINESRTLVYAA